jgi:hypothetical protein
MERCATCAGALDAMLAVRFAPTGGPRADHARYLLLPLLSRNQYWEGLRSGVGRQRNR